jgi:hypothetical protein
MFLPNALIDFEAKMGTFRSIKWTGKVLIIGGKALRDRSEKTAPNCH